MPCQQEKDTMAKQTLFSFRILHSLSLIIWILVPLAIAIIGFASYTAGVFFFIYSLFKIGVEAIKLFGNPDKWIPGYKEKKAKEVKMAHYFYHCEKNPTGFMRLKIENNDKEEAEQADALNPHAFGTFGTSAAEQPLVPKASGGK